MKHRIIITMITSAAVFWTIVFITLIFACVKRKRNIAEYNSQKMETYRNVYLALNLVAAFLLFELFSFVIAILIKSIILSVALHFIAWYISLWTGHRIFPHIVNRLVDFVINMKRKF